MSEYNILKKGKLVLKSEKSSKKRKRKHKDHVKVEEKPNIDEDAVVNGGWWSVRSVKEMTGSIALQFGNRTYVTALDNGLFTLGAPHDEGDGPAPEEVLTAVVVSDTKVAFKSGYGKYLGLDKDGTVIGRADAIGSLEQWEPVFENGNLAISHGGLGRFMSISEGDDMLVAKSTTAEQKEFLVARSCALRDTDRKPEIPLEEEGSLKDVEVNYVKKFQKFQDKKLKVNANSASELRKAKDSGSLHEVLLDRRSKMKADRYCK